MSRHLWRSEVLVSLLLIAAAGCASTRMTSQVNPGYVGRHFNKVFIHGNFQSLEQRHLAEEELCVALARTVPWECLKSAEVLFPGQFYSPEQIRDRLDELGVDAVLVLQPTGSGTSSIYIPPSTHTTATASAYGNAATASSTTYTSGGFNLSMPWTNYEVMLWSRADGQVAWYATAVSSGNEFAGWDDLIRSAARKTVERLAADGIIR